MDKPLFFPLKACWYRAFERGDKTIEYRSYGPRWNERHVRVGRAATLSLGYSGPRMSRIVSAVQILSASDAPAEAREIYHNAEIIIAIHLAPL